MTDEIKTGGPAFAATGRPDQQFIEQEGMTLLDYFAAKAMQGIIRRWDGHGFGGGPNSPEYKELAYSAYLIADAMIKARG
ncbi:TPA: hypothetical protein ACF58L_004029 [Yersinia enterocolitica]